MIGQRLDHDDARNIWAALSLRPAMRRQPTRLLKAISMRCGCCPRDTSRGTSGGRRWIAVVLDAMGSGADLPL